MLTALRVAVGKERDDEYGLIWYAQGLDIDFAASGRSLEDVQLRFSKGLHETIRAHQELYGHTANLLRTPASVWRGFQDDDLWEVIGFEVIDEPDAEDFPFTQLAYLESRRDAA